MTADRDEWLTVQEAASELGIGVRTVWRYLADTTTETIPRMKVGKTRRVHLPSLVDYEATVQPGRPPKP